MEEAHRDRRGLLFYWNCSTLHCVTISHGSNPAWFCELWENFAESHNTTTSCEHGICSLAAGCYQLKCCSTETCSASRAFTIPDTLLWEDSLEADLHGWADAPFHPCPWVHTLALHRLHSRRDVHAQPPPTSTNFLCKGVRACLGMGAGLHPEGCPVGLVWDQGGAELQPLIPLPIFRGQAESSTEGILHELPKC